MSEITVSDVTQASFRGGVGFTVTTSEGPFDLVGEHVWLSPDGSDQAIEFEATVTHAPSRGLPRAILIPSQAEPRCISIEDFCRLAMAARDALEDEAGKTLASIGEDRQVRPIVLKLLDHGEHTRYLIDETNPSKPELVDQGQVIEYSL